jgi:hypothetical protein
VNSDGESFQDRLNTALSMPESAHRFLFVYWLAATEWLKRNGEESTISRLPPLIGEGFPEWVRSTEDTIAKCEMLMERLRRIEGYLGHAPRKINPKTLEDAKCLEAVRWIRAATRGWPGCRGGSEHNHWRWVAQVPCIWAPGKAQSFAVRFFFFSTSVVMRCTLSINAERTHPIRTHGELSLPDVQLLSPVRVSATPRTKTNPWGSRWARLRRAIFSRIRWSRCGSVTVSWWRAMPSCRSTLIF